MRIAHIVRTMNPKAGGPPEGIKMLGSSAVKRGHDVTIVTLDSPTDPWLSEINIKTIALGPSYLTYGLNVRLVNWLREFKNSFDVFILNGIWQFHTVSAWWVLGRNNKKYIVYPHGMLDPWFQKNSPIKAIKKIIYWRLFESKVIRDAGFIAFTSEDEMMSARNSFKPYHAIERIVGYGIKDSLVSYPKNGDKIKKQTEVSRKFKTILFLSRIHPKKGCDLLLKGFNRFLKDQGPNKINYRLTIAGPSSRGYRLKIDSMITSMGLSESITVMDMVTGKNKWDIFDSADIFCLPSHQENFGIVVAEALSRSCPVLISDRVNIHSEVKQSNAGIVGSDSEESVYQMLVKWYSLSLEEQNQMRVNARSCYESLYNIESVVNILLGYLEQLKLGDKITD